MNRLWAVGDVAAGIFVATVLVVWLFQTLRGTPEPAALLRKWLVTAAAFYLLYRLGRAGITHTPILLLPCLPILFLLGVYWAPEIGEKLAGTVAGILDGGNTPPDNRAAYSIAETHRLRGRTDEATLAVSAELEKKPGDCRGLLLLAAIHAEDRRDLPSAASFIESIVAEPSIPTPGKAAALQQLADWHLSIGRDIGAARATLERIVQSWPNSPESNAAAQRLAHLEEGSVVLAKTERGPIALGQYEQKLGLRTRRPPTLPAGPPPEQLRAEYRQHLARHPLDTEMRERLARLLAGDLHDLPAAKAELELLIGRPGATPREVVRWLNQLADLQVLHGRDISEPQATLERITTLYPRTTAAQVAQNRIAYLPSEFRMNRTRPDPPAEDPGP